MRRSGPRQQNWRHVRTAEVRASRSATSRWIATAPSGAGIVTFLSVRVEGRRCDGVEALHVVPERGVDTRGVATRGQGMTDIIAVRPPLCLSKP